MRFAFPKMLLLFLSILILPHKGFGDILIDSRFPDLSSKADISRILYASFRQALFNQDVTMTFSNKEKYTIHYSRNNVFSAPLTTTNSDTILSRFQSVQNILRLWTLDTDFKPNYLSFRNFTTFLSGMILDLTFDQELLTNLFADATTFDSAKFKELAFQIYGVGTVDEIVVKLSNEFPAEIQKQKKEGQIGRLYQEATSDLLNGIFSVVTNPPEAAYFADPATLVQRLDFKIVDTKLNKFVLQFVDSPISKQILDLLRQSLQQLNLDTTLVESISITEVPLVDETFFDTYSQRQVLARLNAIKSLLLQVPPLVANQDFATEPLGAKVNGSFEAVLLLVNKYITFYNDTYEPNFNLGFFE